MSVATIRDLNASYSCLENFNTFSDVGEALVERFSFITRSFLYTDKNKRGKWDGRIKLVQWKNGVFVFPSGLKHAVADFLNKSGVSCIIEDMNIFDGDICLDTVQSSLKPRPYQEKAIRWILRNKRGIIVSATSSGKTLVAYFILQKLAEWGKRSLFIVPRVDLVKQLYKDFEAYGLPVDEETMHISTWQSLQNKPRDFFAQFDAVYVDEVHLATAKVLRKIVLACVNADYRIGQTGTIDDTKAHVMFLEGLFGPHREFVSMNDLIQMNFAARTKCEFVILNGKYPSFKSYQDEIAHLLQEPIRNIYIAGMVRDVKGNSFFMTKTVDHAKKMAEIVSRISKKKCFVLHGKSSKDEREKVYNMFRMYDDCVLFATYGLISTGLNITNLDNLFIGAPIKSFVTHIQSIGRVVRKNGDRNAVVYDFIDKDIGGKQMYSSSHGIQRIKHIVEAGIPVVVKEISLIKDSEDE